VFGNCNPEELLEWQTKRTKIEIKLCEEHPDEAAALKAIDEESGEIVGYACWAWTLNVRISLSSFTFPRNR